MPPRTLFDISNIEIDKTVHDLEFIRTINPQRFEFEQLSSIAFVDKTRAVAFRDVRHDEFWIKGHIPGRPLMPGVMMIEAAAQLASFFTKTQLHYKGFIGFGGVEKCKFRMPVEPGARLYVLLELVWERHRRVCCATQGIVSGNVVFEADVIGSEF